MNASSHLSISRNARGPRCSLRVSGELDLATAAMLEDAVAEAGGGDLTELELDFREVTFIDLCGLRAIMRAREQCRRQRVQLLLVPSPRYGFRRLLDLAGVAGELPLREAEATR
jgi:anti-anti-sigma factor